ncbi:MAG: CBS domain-containing protein [Verrucomicrobia bacterium]|nr:MAG: CBS domain-containing protein [Verrucomicrobiota bacterium]
MKTIRQLLASKGSQVWTIAPGASVFDALQLMADKGIGALLVTEGERVVGVISERDYARKVALRGKLSKTLLVKDIMTSPVTSVSPDQNTEECMALMTDKHIRHLPVLESGKLIGVVSIGDLVKNIISEQKILIKNLEQYIGGAPV